MQAFADTIVPDESETVSTGPSDMFSAHGNL